MEIQYEVIGENLLLDQLRNRTRKPNGVDSGLCTCISCFPFADRYYKSDSMFLNGAYLHVQHDGISIACKDQFLVVKENNGVVQILKDKLDCRVGKLSGDRKWGLEKSVIWFGLWGIRVDKLYKPISIVVNDGKEELFCMSI